MPLASLAGDEEKRVTGCSFLGDVDRSSTRGVRKDRHPQSPVQKQIKPKELKTKREKPIKANVTKPSGREPTRH